MPGSPEAVPTLPSPEPFPAAGIAGPPPSPSVASRRQASAVSKVSWRPQADLGQTEWLAAGRRLGAIGRCSQWWIGDWVRYGASRWGERYVEAAKVTGYDVASLRNMAWVAGQFDLSLRSDKLTWSHHVLLAPLEPDEQRRWLARALHERLSVADLRLELRAARDDAAPPVAGEEAIAGAGKVDVCPHCGHELSASTD